MPAKQREHSHSVEADNIRVDIGMAYLEDCLEAIDTLQLLQCIVLLIHPAILSPPCRAIETRQAVSMV